MLWCVLFSQSTHCCVMFVCAAPRRKDFHWTWRLRSPFFGFGFGVGQAWGHGLLLVSLVSKHSPHPRAKTLEDGWTLHVSLFVFGQPLDKQHGKSKISIWDDVSKSWFPKFLINRVGRGQGPYPYLFLFCKWNSLMLKTSSSWAAGRVLSDAIAMKSVLTPLTTQKSNRYNT